MISSRDAVDRVRKFRIKKGRKPKEAAEDLARLAFYRGSSDNISGRIVFFAFDPPAKP